MTVEPGVRVGQDSDASVIDRSWVEPEAFAVLFDRHADAVHRYAARRLGAEAAEDVMAETFTTAFQQRFRYNTELPDARPWLFGIATNLIGRHRRAEARRLKAMSRLPAATPGDQAGETVADQVAARVSAQALRRELAGALARLPARHRDVLLLVAWADLGYEEAARALGVPVGTVRSRLHRARRKVREALGGSDPTALREESDSE
ncbi:RNA polymerase ECF-subfamily sigma factor [Streptomyces lincolnensis]|uniref:RNA polymerase ECF-subfamily sigma factor n=1 Tax=Streptomyces lincolnensis TaxID=1915 RepID=A0A1B1MPG5_STRLN|nr:RNA polymerase sigma factor [Streptomyces lincolnensis]ANS70458.1 RNA polymerase ECF-subfamily sigma factor [Streptomyces lincolnensis]